MSQAARNVRRCLELLWEGWPGTSRAVPQGVDRHEVLLDGEVEGQARPWKADLSHCLAVDLAKDLGPGR